jgi:hypothetical protein
MTEENECEGTEKKNKQAQYARTKIDFVGINPLTVNIVSPTLFFFFSI